MRYIKGRREIRRSYIEEYMNTQTLMDVRDCWRDKYFATDILATYQPRDYLKIIIFI